MIYASYFRGDAIFNIKKYINSITLKNDKIWHNNVRLDLNELLMHEDTTSIYIRDFVMCDMWFYMDLIQCIMYKLNITKTLCLITKQPTYLYNNDKLEKSTQEYDITIASRNYSILTRYNVNVRVLERLQVFSNILNDPESFSRLLDENDEAYLYELAISVLIKNELLSNKECKTILIRHASKYCEFGDEIGL